MLCGTYKNTEQVQLTWMKIARGKDVCEFERGFPIWADCLTGCVSTGTVTKVPSTFKIYGKDISQSSWKNCQLSDCNVPTQCSCIIVKFK